MEAERAAAVELQRRRAGRRDHLWHPAQQLQQLPQVGERLPDLLRLGHGAAVGVEACSLALCFA